MAPRRRHARAIRKARFGGRVRTVKIALVNNYYYLRGGSERVLYDDRDALLAAGHEVLPFAPQDPRNDPALSAPHFPAVGDPKQASGLDLLKSACHVIYSPQVGRAFAGFVDSFRPDLIHCHNIYGRLTTSVLDQARRRGIPVVMTVHDLKLACPAYLGLRHGQPCLLCQDGGYWRCARYKCHKSSAAASLAYTAEAYFARIARKYNAVARFLCPSRFIQGVLLDAGVPAERVVYHPNALQADRYAPGPEPGEYLFYAGRLSSEKGLFTLLDAIESARLPLRIAGAGPLDHALRTRIQERRLPVRMEGYCHHERLADLYRNAAFVVAPSEWYENAPMAVLEAFAYGKPVLASRIGGNPELVLEGQSGCLFAPGNAGDLASAAGAMWKDRPGLARMGRQARELVRQRFSCERRNEALLGIYREMIPAKHIQWEQMEIGYGAR